LENAAQAAAAGADAIAVVGALFNAGNHSESITQVARAFSRVFDMH
jgi:thiamine monophosphate synthase